MKMAENLIGGYVATGCDMTNYETVDKKNENIANSSGEYSCISNSVFFYMQYYDSGYWKQRASWHGARI